VRANFVLALIGILCMAACGGGSTLGGSTTGGGGTVSNVQSVTVDSGPSLIANSDEPAINTLYTTVTICSPGSTTNCQTIDHIQVDTGSSGLRIVAGTGSIFSLTLPAAMDASGNVLAECTQFVDGSSWGPIRLADIKVAGETASNMEVQVIGDGAYTAVPSACPGTAENTVMEFGANGILGVGPFISDCGGACTTPNTIYYTCPTPTSCAASTVAEASQVSNPVASFATDNNGVIIELPAVASGGAASVTGSLIFGIGTQSNNGMPTGTQILTVDPDSGSLATTYKGAPFPDSFIDSGSNAYFFNDSSINPCPADANGFFFYCPTSPLSETGIMQGVNGTSVSVGFSVVSETSYLNGATAIAAAPGLAGNDASSTTNSDPNDTSNTSFDWGLPFHFGRNVYTAIETRTAAGVVGPYFAF
jgi:Protein of unknown function (DUF3443)